jgi:hypothetical protein
MGWGEKEGMEGRKWKERDRMDGGDGREERED